MSSDPKSGSELARPPRANARNTTSTLWASLRNEEARASFVLPLAAFVLIFIVARVKAPAFGPGSASEYSSFFGTVAQVIAAVLIALALELRTLPFRDLNTRRWIVGVSLLYVALGLAAAVIALNPGLSPTLDRWLFALAIAAGAAALLSVLTISLTLLKNEAATQRDKASR